MHRKWGLLHDLSSQRPFESIAFISFVDLEPRGLYTEANSLAVFTFSSLRVSSLRLSVTPPSSLLIRVLLCFHAHFFLFGAGLLGAINQYWKVWIYRGK